MGVFGKGLSARQERAVQKTLEQIRAQRRSRFRILACLKNDENDFDVVRMAARLAPKANGDIIIVYVRPIDQGLWSGGLQLRLARQNMLDAGLELPGLQLLKRSLDVLREEGIPADEWERETANRSAWGDPVGDNKVVFNGPDERSVVLKLKTAPDPASGILDQYELGPYNLIILGEPSRWRSEVKSWFGTGVVQRVAVLAPCSVMVSRASLNKRGFLLYTDGSARYMQAVRRTAILAASAGEPVTLLAVAASEGELRSARDIIKRSRDMLASIGLKVKKGIAAHGDPVEQIVAHGADFKVIMVCDAQRSALSRALRASVAFGVMREATTSVLDVR